MFGESSCWCQITKIFTIKFLCQAIGNECLREWERHEGHISQKKEIRDVSNKFISILSLSTDSGINTLQLKQIQHKLTDALTRQQTGFRLLMTLWKVRNLNTSLLANSKQLPATQLRLYLPEVQRREEKTDFSLFLLRIGPFGLFQFRTNFWNYESYRHLLGHLGQGIGSSQVFS